MMYYTTLPKWEPYTGVVGPTLAWSGGGVPPQIGTKVYTPGNAIGVGTVLRYFSDSGFLGVEVLPEDPPIWYAEQNGLHTPCHLFGAELDHAVPTKLPKQKGRYRPARVLKKWREQDVAPRLRHVNLGR